MKGGVCRSSFLRKSLIEKLKYLFFALLWVGVAAYIGYALSLSRVHDKGRKITKLEIEVADSTSRGYLVTSQGVRKWIKEGDRKLVGHEVQSVNLVDIERVIGENGFIERVAAYVNYSGVLRVEISQRKPFLRLMTDGQNSYITKEGYVFSVPSRSSVYVPVVTGPYVVPFAQGYTGLLRDEIDRRIQLHEDEIEKLEREKHPFYLREISNEQRKEELRKDRVRREWWRLESAENFSKRVVEKRQEKAALRNRYRYEEILIRQGIDRLTQAQDNERNEQKKLEKNYQDFMKLLTFVGKVENDSFWRSEVVQIVARATPSGALEVDLIPRSGGHMIVFGKLERVDEKFSRLMKFYRNGLSKIGWNTYRKIDVRYDNQVICSK